MAGSESTENDEDGPDLSDDDRADVDLDALEEVSDQVAAETADEDDDQDDVDEPHRDGAEETALDEDLGDITIGHVYCRGLGVSAALAIESYGDGAGEGQDREDLIEEYAGLAKQMDLDRYMDQWMQEQGMGDEISPGAALVAFTGMFALTVAMSDDQLLNALSEGAGS